MSKSLDNISQDEKSAPILRIAASDQSASLDQMLLQGRSLSGHERNCCFLNTLSSENSGGRFATISAISGLDFDDDGQAAARVDWDLDGDVDLVLSNRNAPRVRFMRNENATQNGYVQFRLVGNGNDTNRNAIGARITVVLQPDSTDPDAPPVKLIKTIRAGDGYLTQSSLCAHFGLGKNPTIQSVQVQWPNRSGELEVFESVKRNRRYRLVQGTGEATVMETDRENLAIKPSFTKIPDQDVVMRIPLMHQFRAPDLSYDDFDGDPQRFHLPKDEVVLVNLWSTTCAPCVKELTEFSERHQELRSAGVRVLALCIDEIQSMPNAGQQAREMAERMKFPFLAGMATNEIIGELSRYHNALIRMNRPLPMPSSFLIDRNGRLNTIYKGPVDVDTLMDDAKPLDLDLMERFARSAPFKGTVLDSPLITESMERYEAGALIRLGKDYLKQNQLVKAESVFRDAVEQVPDSASIHNLLAIVYGRQNKIQQAIESYRDAVKIKPDKAELRINLARSLIRLQEYEEAGQHLDHAILNSPEQADAHYNRGLVYSAQRDVKNEQACYERVLELKPNHAQALFRLGRIFELNDNLAKATEYYEQAVAAAPRRAAVLTGLARVRAANGRLDEAEKLLRKAIDSEPRFADARFQLGQVLLATGKQPEAQQQFMTVLQLNRNHQGALNALRQLQDAAGPGK